MSLIKHTLQFSTFQKWVPVSCPVRYWLYWRPDGRIEGDMSDVVVGERVKEEFRQHALLREIESNNEGALETPCCFIWIN